MHTSSWKRKKFPFHPLYSIELLWLSKNNLFLAVSGSLYLMFNLKWVFCWFWFILWTKKTPLCFKIRHFWAFLQHGFLCAAVLRGPFTVQPAGRHGDGGRLAPSTRPYWHKCLCSSTTSRTKGTGWQKPNLFPYFRQKGAKPAFIFKKRGMPLWLCLYNKTKKTLCFPLWIIRTS